jgi:trk system potassium uptake protein TrkH
LATADIPVFARAINAYAEKEYPRMPALQLHLDCKLSPAYLTLDLAENLQLLEPCGTDNPAALFILATAMVVGRLGPMTIAYAINRPRALESIRYPNEPIVVG